MADETEITLVWKKTMIRLTRLNRAPLVVNSDLIEHVETTPDTVIFMTTGQKFVVLETPDAVIEKIRAFRRSIGCGWSMTPGPAEESN
jgi:flagellar protein FlbD